jgi:phage gp36-like protein
MANFIQEQDYEVQAREEMMRLISGGNEAAILKAERFAISQIRKYIGGRYDCDRIFSRTGDERDDYIIMITIDIAIYHLWSKKAPKNTPEHRKIRYDDALAWLTSVGSGETPTDLPQLQTENYKGEIRIYSLHKPNNNKY